MDTRHREEKKNKARRSEGRRVGMLRTAHWGARLSTGSGVWLHNEATCASTVQTNTVTLKKVTDCSNQPELRQSTTVGEYNGRDTYI